MVNTIQASSSVYEVLLIILVVVLIFNGLRRNKILKKVDNQMSGGSKNTGSNPKAKKLNKKKEGEYVDYEVVDE